MPVQLALLTAVFAAVLQDARHAKQAIIIQAVFALSVMLLQVFPPVVIPQLHCLVRQDSILVAPTV